MGRSGILAVLSLCLGSIASASAQSNVFGGNPPHYFSGTGCRVWGSAVVTGAPTTGFVEAKIVVQGVVVKHWSSTEPALQHLTLSAVIDSTHFAHDSEVAVSFLARGDDNVWYTSPIAYVPVYNVAGIFGRHDIEVAHLSWGYTTQHPEGEWLTGDSSWKSCDTVADAYLAMNHFIYGDGPRVEAGWDWADLSLGIQGSTSMFISTHGGIGEVWSAAYFLTDSDDATNYYPNAPNEEDKEHVVGTSVYEGLKEILPVRVNANGTGLPPYNTGNPPMNFVWVNACKSGYQDVPTIDNTFPEAFLHPIDNAFHPTPIPENQAYCGYLINFLLRRNADTTAEFFERLKSGYTVNQAREFAYIAYANWQVPRNFQTLAHEWMAVYGDWKTRVHGVYTGIEDHDPVTEWYR